MAVQIQAKMFPPTIKPRRQCDGFRVSRPLIFLTLDYSEDRVPAYHEERMKEGKVIKVQDVAFITYVDPSSAPVPDRPISLVSKRFCSTCTPVVSSLRLLGQKPTAKHGLLKSYLLPQIAFPDLHLNLSTVLQIKYLLLPLMTRTPNSPQLCSTTSHHSSLPPCERLKKGLDSAMLSEKPSVGLPLSMSKQHEMRLSSDMRITPQSS